jgi:hypothetical protein
MATAVQQPEVHPVNIPSISKSRTIIAGADHAKEEAKRQAELLRTKRARQMQELQLQRENILSQKTSQPVRRAALAAALAQIEGQIEALQ